MQQTITPVPPDRAVTARVRLTLTREAARIAAMDRYQRSERRRAHASMACVGLLLALLGLLVWGVA